MRFFTSGFSNNSAIIQPNSKLSEVMWTLRIDMYSYRNIMQCPNYFKATFVNYTFTRARNIPSYLASSPKKLAQKAESRADRLPNRRQGTDSQVTPPYTCIFRNFKGRVAREESFIPLRIYETYSDLRTSTISRIIPISYLPQPDHILDHRDSTKPAK